MHHPLARASRRPSNHRLPLGLRLVERGSTGNSPHPLARDATLARLEAALFLAEEPLAPRKLAGLVGLADAAAAREQVERLRKLYDEEGTAFQIEELAGGYQLLTRPVFFPWLARLRQHAGNTPLSAAARETLTIIAYRQPITRADIEAIRGVSCSEVLKLLMEKNLVRLAGREDTLGRPALYETTRRFLQEFGLRSLRDLPPGEGLGPTKPDADSVASPSVGEG
jgi:segregation and condensation protein B